MKKIAVIVLAAGLGKRTGSSLPKVLIKTSQDKPLISYVLDTLEQIKADKLAMVVGSQKELVISEVKSLSSGMHIKPEFCVQVEQNGTGDAAKAAKTLLADFSGPVLIMCGDMPLISKSSLESLISTHETAKATITFLTLNLEYDNSYGRIVRDENGFVSEIRERKDCSEQQIAIKERNLAVYCVESSFLFSALDRLENNNAQKEFYLTDIIKIAATEGQTVMTVSCQDAEEALGVNDLADLMQINEILRKRVINDLARKGVKFSAPESVVIDPQVKIESGVVIGPAVQILGQSSVGSDVIIEGSSLIRDSSIANNCTIKLGSYITQAVLEDSVKVGPFVQIRPKTHLKKDVVIGNFVELKNARLEKGVKANHLSYLGDCEIGEGSNIGAGTITCNYDGVKKSRTSIGKGVFVGSNTALVAPVSLGDNSVIGAGSVITKDVQAEALALTRAPQVSKTGWATKRKI